MKKRILIADDDNGIVRMLRMMLEHAGYIVATTANNDTVHKAKSYLPDLLLLDISMIGVNGGDICSYLKRQKLTKYMPIIMMSANDDIVTSTKKAGADDYLAKPFDMNNLLRKVAKYSATTEHNSLRLQSA